MTVFVDLGLLILRVVVGLLFVGHGAQKLFGWFGGKGIEAHVGMMEKLGVRPPRFWAYLSALSEFLGGLGLALGLLTPLASAALIGVMLVAIAKVHWAKGLWNSGGGFEYNLVLATVAFVVGFVGPGDYSLDNILPLTVPEPQAYLAALLAMLVLTAGALVAAPAGSRPRRHSA